MKCLSVTKAASTQLQYTIFVAKKNKNNVFNFLLYFLKNYKVDMTN